MKTLIELYDERPVENVLSTEVFRPERTVFLYPPEMIDEEEARRRICLYAERRGLTTKWEFVPISRYDTASIQATLKQVVLRYPDCVLDITGGTDAALFAAGMLCGEVGMPAFTFSRKTMRFYNIHHAPFVGELPKDLRYGVEDYFQMAGGKMRQGRMDNTTLSAYAHQIPQFFELYMRYKREWQQMIAYFQRVSYHDKALPLKLTVEAPLKVKGEHGEITANLPLLRELEQIGLIRQLHIVEGEPLSFTFLNGEVRAWLRDVGSVLELFVYQNCVDLGIFDEVRASVVVDWEDSGAENTVTNEIDVMATKSILPLFISAKTGHVSTDALNELAILRDRFGGKLAKAAIVTAQHCRAITRHRADELDILVIDLDDLKEGRLPSLFHQLMQKP